jgi:histidyl-tRNA synthetase
VGASLGLDRLLDALSRLGAVGAAGPSQSTARVLVAVLDAERWADYLVIAEELRRAGIPTELYLDQRKLDRQLKYADRKGIPIVVIAGESELACGTAAVKDLRRGVQEDQVPRAVLAARISELLSAAPAPPAIQPAPAGPPAPAMPQAVRKGDRGS